MAKINTHGLKMDGLRKASGATCSWAGYTQISYDMDDGSILYDDHSDRNSWSQYHSSSIITVARATSHMTMQQIADAVYDKVTEHKYMLSQI